MILQERLLKCVPTNKNIHILFHEQVIFAGTTKWKKTYLWLISLCGSLTGYKTTSPQFKGRRKTHSWSLENRFLWLSCDSPRYPQWTCPLSKRNDYLLLSYIIHTDFIHLRVWIYKPMVWKSKIFNTNLDYDPYPLEGSPRDVMVKKVDCSLEVRVRTQSSSYFLFWTTILGKGKAPLSAPTSYRVSSITVRLPGWLLQ